MNEKLIQRVLISGHECILDSDINILDLHVSVVSAGYRILRYADNRIFARVLLNVPKGMQADHINRNTLDNRRANLRIVTPSQNSMNRRGDLIRKKVQLPKGVYQNNTKKYYACITVQGRKINLGSYITIDSAKKAYEAAALEYFGEYRYQEV